MLPTGQLPQNSMDTSDPTAGDALQAAFEAMVLDWQDVTAHSMFGHPSYKAAGIIFALLVTEGVILTRLSVDERPVLAARFETGPFEANGQTVSKWVRVGVGPDELDGLEPFVRASHEAARSESRDVPPPANES